MTFEPAYVDELAEIMRWGFGYMQEEEGGSLYLRLSTRALEQPDRTLSEAQRAAIVAGAYWLREPGPEADVAIIFAGAMASEVMEAAEILAEDMPDVGILSVTSSDRLFTDWQAPLRAGTPSHVDALMSSSRHGRGWSPCRTAILAGCPGLARRPVGGSIPLVSLRLASLAISPICSRPTVSTPRRSSTWRPAPVLTPREIATIRTPASSFPSGLPVP